MSNKNNSNKKSTSTSQKKVNANHEGDLTARQRVYIRKFVEEFKRTDSGNADYLVSRYGNIIRYNHTIKKWLLWNGNYWVIDRKDGIINLTQKAARKRQREILDNENPELLAGHATHALNSENQSSINKCINLVKANTKISTLSEEWDKHKHLIQYTNGIYDLNKQEFYPGRPELMISQCVGYDYDEAATSPRWVQFIDEVFDGNTELINYVQKAIGYSITGDTREQCLFIMEGIGSNGKSVFLIIVRKILGDYAYDTPFSTFEKKYGNTPSNDLARLHTVRLVTSSETNKDKILDEGRLKAITGGDSVTARFLNREYFTYYPKYKIWLAVNDLPTVEDKSKGFWRRIRVIPFRVLFEDKSDDKNLETTLKKELPGIMNWVIEGNEKYQKEGLKPPKEVILATQEYHHQFDIVSEWLDDTIIKQTGSTIGATDLYNKFKEWQKIEYPDEELSQRAFGLRVKNYLGYSSIKMRSIKIYVGINYKNNHENNEIVNIQKNQI
jgi:putative DNA primase/helicase